MILTDSRVIKPSNAMYKELDMLCFLSKNLYNSTLYAARQSFFVKSYKNYNSINKEFTDNNQVDYRALPAKVAKQTQMLVDKNFKSFFALSQRKKEGKLGEKLKPKPPKYLDKVNGRQVVVYPKDALSFAKEGYIRLSKTNVFIKNFFDRESVRQVRVVPHAGYIAIEILYTKECKKNPVTQKYASIDMGINNLATLTSTEFSPLIVNGKPAKSINRYYNKLIARKKSIIARSGHTASAEVDSMWRRRTMRLNDYLHKASRLIVNHLVSHDISHLIVGYNKGWKQDTKLGRANNQKFAFVPFLRFVEMLTYKCALEGITIVLQEESYTSKASFMDGDAIPIYGSGSATATTTEFSGRRVHRGLYQTKSGERINADVNGSLNILKKYAVASNIWTPELETRLLASVHGPRRITCSP